MPETSPSKRPAAQAAFAKKAADAKAAKATPSALAPDLIEANEQALAEEARLHAASTMNGAFALRARLPGGWVSGCSRNAKFSPSPTSRFPTIWAWMRPGTFPRARVVGGKSMWVLTCTSKPNAVVQPRGVAAIRTSVIRGTR